MNWLAIAPWAVALAGLLGGCGYGLVERGNYLEEKAGRAADKAAIAAAVANQVVADQKQSQQLLVDQAVALAGIHAQALSSLQKVTNAPVTNTCGPVMRAASHGVSELLRPDGGHRAAPAGSGAPAPLH